LTRCIVIRWEITVEVSSWLDVGFCVEGQWLPVDGYDI